MMPRTPSPADHPARRVAYPGSASLQLVRRSFRPNSDTERRVAEARKEVAHSLILPFSGRRTRTACWTTFRRGRSLPRDWVIVHSSSTRTSANHGGCSEARCRPTQLTHTSGVLTHDALADAGTYVTALDNVELTNWGSAHRFGAHRGQPDDPEPIHVRGDPTP